MCVYKGEFKDYILYSINITVDAKTNKDKINLI